MMQLRTIHAGLIATSLALAACGGPEEDLGGDTSNLDGSPRPPSRIILEAYGRAATANPNVTCTSASAVGAFIPVFDLLNWRWAWFFGIVDNGQLEIVGASGTSRPASSAVAAGS